MKTFILLSLSTLFLSPLAMAQNWTSEIECQGTRLVVQTAYTDNQNQYQVLLKNAQDQQTFMQTTGVGNVNNDILSLGGVGTGVVKFSNGTYFLNIKNNSTSEYTAIYIYKTGETTARMDAYRSVQTGPSTWNNIRKLSTFDFPACH